MTAARFQGRLRDTLRTSWRPAAWGVAVGLLLQVLLPVSMPWLPAAAAVAFAALALVLLGVGEWTERRHRRGMPDVDERGLDRSVLLERWSTPAQFGYAFGAGSLILLALALGFGIGHLVGF